MAWVDQNSSKRSAFDILAAARVDPRPASYFTDPDDFCRRCRGTGTERFSDESAFICDLCGGSGCRSVRIT